MKTIHTAFLAASLALLAVAAGPLVAGGSSARAQDGTRIMTEQELREKVVGRRISDPSGYVIIHADGTVSGAFGKGGKDKLTGRWTWEGEHYCRTIEVGGTDYGRDCQVLEVSGETLWSTTNEGKGERSSWKLEAASEAVSRVRTEAQLREKVVGRRISDPSGYVIIHADGTVSGAFGKGGKDKLTGRWTWEGEYYCRTIEVGGTDYGRDCQVLEVSGETLWSTTNEGKGQRSVWTLE